MEEELSQQRTEAGSVGFSSIQVIHGNLAKYNFRGKVEVKSDCSGLRNE